MRKLLLLSTTLCGISWAVSATTIVQNSPNPIETCEIQAPYGFPQISKEHSVSICRTAYVLLEDTEAKIPIWVAYTLTPEHAMGCLPRINAFEPDQSLPKGQRSELLDYSKSGYDTGHIANDSDMSWDMTIERESFILSNMTPQLASLNRGIWKVLETSVRAWVFNTQHKLTIYAGPIYDVVSDKKIGPNNVDVPHAFYKIVIDDTTHQSLAFIFPHENGLGKDLSKMQSTVANVEKATGITFNVPDDKTIMNTLWHIDDKERDAAKKTECDIVYHLQSK